MASYTQVSPNNPVRPTLLLYLPNAATRLTLRIQSPSTIHSAELIMKLPTMPSPAVNCFPFPFNHKYLPQHSILRHPQYMFITQCKANVLRPYLKRHIIFLFILIFIYFDNKIKNIYWKNGDAVKDKICTAISMQ